MTLVFATAVALLVASAAGRAVEDERAPPLERIVVAGATETDGSRLADVPFSSSRGYGYVRGWLQRREDAVLFGGEADWPAVWREGVEKYVRAAKADYRDVLGWAEYPNQVRSRRAPDDPGRRILIEKDAVQYRAWLRE